jgi:subtilisin family serine protease
MAQPGTGRRHLLALTAAVLALTASVGFLPPGSGWKPSAAGPPAAPVVSGPPMSYVVNVSGGARTAASVRRAIADAGGTVVIAYDRIGVVVVRSENPDFAGEIRRIRGVESAGATRTAPLPAVADTSTGAGPPLTDGEIRAAARLAAAGEEELEPLQWSLPAIRAERAHAHSIGSDRVTVAVIDTGVDDTHPDLAPNFDAAGSASCVGGRPDPTPGSGRPAPGESDHGTHVAGTVAAARNGTGVVGVAPGVRISGIKVSDPAGFFYTEAVVCAFVWAADHGADVTNNSYYVDPWLFNCASDPDQKALAEAVMRAVRYAERKGAVNVAAAGNSRMDLAADTLTDTSSPNDSTPLSREISPLTCPDIPTQLPGVVTTSALGAKGLKSSFSNYGDRVINIAAPGGDATRYQAPAAPAVDGRILSTLPGGRYGYKAGTSMASPHVAGVVALIRSRHPQLPPAAVKTLLYRQADDTDCGAPYDYNGDGTPDAVCEGDRERNGFYGEGVADALDAVRR